MYLDNSGYNFKVGKEFVFSYGATMQLVKRFVVLIVMGISLLNSWCCHWPEHQSHS